MPLRFLSSLSLALTALLLLGKIGSAQGASTEAAEKNVFGVPTPTSASLMGVLYDLKQTERRLPTKVTPVTYSNVIDEFLRKGWDDNVLNRYYQVANSLYASQIFIPNMNADAAPKAFNAAKTVRPRMWIIHYKGQVSPPSTGSYRFWGCADDVMAVAVNGKTVLVGNRPDTKLPNVKWKASEPDGAQAADDPLRPGDWMDLKADQIVDLDVIIGERPGGYFNAFMMVEKKGENYDKDSKGHSIFPIFQIAPYDTPAINGLSFEPKFAKGSPIWKGYQ
jgi:hypothetical protein